VPVHAAGAEAPTPMRVFFDTSVLVAAIVEGHKEHDRAFPWLDRARTGGLTYLVAAHSLAELYAMLSSYPAIPRIAPGVAARLVRENVEAVAQVTSLSAADYAAVIRSLAELSLTGGVVYDALLARAAHKARADRLLTLNPRDFLRVWPEGAGIVVAP
jgi:predicted nucleic acid-binding protein